MTTSTFKQFPEYFQKQWDKVAKEHKLEVKALNVVYKFKDGHRDFLYRRITSSVHFSLGSGRYTFYAEAVPFEKCCGLRQLINFQGWPSEKQKGLVELYKVFIEALWYIDCAYNHPGMHLVALVNSIPYHPENKIKVREDYGWLNEYFQQFKVFSTETRNAIYDNHSIVLIGITPPEYVKDVTAPLTTGRKYINMNSDKTAGVNFTPEKVAA